MRLGSHDVTLPDLLREAEETLIMEEDGPIMDLSPVASRTNVFSVLKTPNHDMPSFFKDTPRVDSPVVAGPRDWTKADWKTLDRCYTDERLFIGSQVRLPAGKLAAAEDVDPERVVNRFIGVMGGRSVVDKLGSAWTRYVLY